MPRPQLMAPSHPLVRPQGAAATRCHPFWCMATVLEPPHTRSAWATRRHTRIRAPLAPALAPAPTAVRVVPGPVRSHQRPNCAWCACAFPGERERRQHTSCVATPRWHVPERALCAHAIRDGLRATRHVPQPPSLSPSPPPPSPTSSPLPFPCPLPLRPPSPSLPIQLDCHPPPTFTFPLSQAHGWSRLPWTVLCEHGSSPPSWPTASMPPPPHPHPRPSSSPSP